VILFQCWWTGCWLYIPRVSGQTAALPQQGGVGMIAGVLGQRCLSPAFCSLSLGGG